ncbi:MAG: alanyl-tRNA editing protein [Pseudomonadota bacterium]
MTHRVFYDDAYAATCEATITDINARGGIVLDRTIFYANSGGQPGDEGTLQSADGVTCTIATTVHDADARDTIVHVPADAAGDLSVGDKVTITLDWARRHQLMRMHTCMHLMCAVIPYPVTGGQIGVGEGRLDFDIADASAIDKETLTAQLNELIAGDHAVTTTWITDEELTAKPELVRTMSVKPPMGSGRVRIVRIGEEGAVDLQPCGGTHVKTTSEIGRVVVKKVEKKGRQNRRIRLAFDG